MKSQIYECLIEIKVGLVAKVAIVVRDIGKIPGVYKCASVYITAEGRSLE